VDEACSPAVLVEALARAEARVAARAPSMSSRTWFSPSTAAAVGIRAPTLVGRSAAMISLLSKLRRLAPHAASVMLYGESGTGKELAARALHAWSQRSDGPFVAVNVAAIPNSLFESALFGHVRGAFTDAVRDRPGFFEEADGGTLFLDEVADLPLASQVKLLRVLEDQSIRRVGDNEERRVNVRVVAATARDLEEEARRGRFRDDLLFRVAGLTLRLPPLRERREDIPVLVEHFIARIEARLGAGLGTQLGTAAHSVTPAALDRLVGHSWPGNVRELENSLERAVVLCEGDVIDVRDLPEKLWSAAMRSLEAEVSRVPAHEEVVANPLALKPALARVERELIRQALAEAGDRRADAARKLGISHRTLLYKLKEHGLGSDRES
jgi:two-component system response regulator AtoC